MKAERAAVLACWIGLLVLVTAQGPSGNEWIAEFPDEPGVVTSACCIEQLNDELLVVAGTTSGVTLTGKVKPGKNDTFVAVLPKDNGDLRGH